MIVIDSGWDQRSSNKTVVIAIKMKSDYKSNGKESLSLLALVIIVTKKELYLNLFRRLWNADDNLKVK